VSDTKKINGKTFFSTSAAAAKLGKSASYISKLCREGKLNAQKVDGAWYIDVPNKSRQESKQKSKSEKVIKQQSARVQKAVKATPAAKSKKSTKKAAAERINSQYVLVATTRPKKWAHLSSVHVRVLPVSIGIVVALILLFQIPHSTLERAVPSVASVNQSINEIPVYAQKSAAHTVKKTSELVDLASITAASGLVSVAKEVASFRQEEPFVHDGRRVTALGRTIQESHRNDATGPFVQQMHATAAAVRFLYGFERVQESNAYLGATIYGVGDHVWCFLKLKTCPSQPTLSADE